MKREKLSARWSHLALAALALSLIVIGYVLMTGPATTPQAFEPDIFSPRRIRLAPLLCLSGYLLIIPLILRKKGRTKEMNPKRKKNKDKRFPALSHRSEEKPSGAAFP